MKTSFELEWFDNIQHLAIMHILHKVIKQGVAVASNYNVECYTIMLQYLRYT